MTGPPRAWRGPVRDALADHTPMGRHCRVARALSTRRGSQVGWGRVHARPTRPESPTHFPTHGRPSSTANPPMPAHRNSATTKSTASHRRPRRAGARVAMVATLLRWAVRWVWRDVPPSAPGKRVGDSTAQFPGPLWPTLTTAPYDDAPDAGPRRKMQIRTPHRTGDPGVPVTALRWWPHYGGP